MLSVTHPASADERRLAGYGAEVIVLLVPLIVAVLFALPFVMAWLEPKQAPTHRTASRRTGSR